MTRVKQINAASLDANSNFSFSFLRMTFESNSYHIMQGYQYRLRWGGGILSVILTLGEFSLEFQRSGLTAVPGQEIENSKAIPPHKNKFWY